MRHAVLRGGKAGRIRTRDVQAIHEDIARADAVYGGWKLRRNVLAVDINYEGCFAGIVKTLTYADGEECRILQHELAGDLVLGGQS